MQNAEITVPQKSGAVAVGTDLGQKNTAETAADADWLDPLSEVEGANLSTDKKNFVADTIQHAFNHRGDPIVEGARGQRAVTPEDIAMIPQVIATPDFVRLSEKADKLGRSVLIFSKLVGDNYITAQAVTDGRHALTTNSIWVQKKKGPLDTTHNTGVTTDPVLNAQNVPPSDLSYHPTLSQEQSGVNTQDMQNGGKDAAGTDLGQKNTAETAAGALPKMSMADFTDVESSAWNNVEYDDVETRADLQGHAHQEMVNL